MLSRRGALAHTAFGGSKWSAHW